MESIKNLRKICQPQGEHPVYKACRVVSIYFTKVFLLVGLTPNIITALGLVLGIIGGVFFIKQYFLWGIISFILFRILDNVDGEVARYRKMSSSFGAWLDTLSGHLLYPYFFFSLGLGLYLESGLFWHLFWGSLAAIVKLIERSAPKVPDKGEKEQLKTAKKKGLTALKEWASYSLKFIVLFALALFFIIIDQAGLYLMLVAIYLSAFVFLKIVLTGYRSYVKQGHHN